MAYPAPRLPGREHSLLPAVAAIAHEEAQSLDRCRPFPICGYETADPLSYGFERTITSWESSHPVHRRGPRDDTLCLGRPGRQSPARWHPHGQRPPPQRLSPVLTGTTPCCAIAFQTSSSWRFRSPSTQGLTLAESFPTQDRTVAAAAVVLIPAQRDRAGHPRGRADGLSHHHSPPTQRK